MDNSCMVDKSLAQFSKKTNKVVKECLPKGVYRDFSKDSYIGFSVIQCWRIIQKGDNVPTIRMEMDWKDENLPLIDLPLYHKDLNDNSRSHVFNKERTQEFWDNMVSKLVSFDSTVISIYGGSKVLRSLTRSINTTIISIVETIQQQLYMKKVYRELYIMPGICIDVFK